MVNPKPVIAVVAVDHLNGIGLNGNIPWHIPEDLQFFKKITTKVSDPENINAVIMGRKTWESIPEKYRPLTNRLNIVLTRSKSGISGAVDCPSLQRAIDHANNDPQVENICIIGGASVYTEAMPLVSVVYRTTVVGDFGCDTRLDANLFDEFTVPSKDNLKEEGFGMHFFYRDLCYWRFTLKRRGT